MEKTKSSSNDNRVDVKFLGTKGMSDRVTVGFDSSKQKQLINPKVDDLLLVANDDYGDGFLRVAVVINSTSELPINHWKYVRNMAAIPSSSQEINSTLNSKKAAKEDIKLYFYQQGCDDCKSVRWKVLTQENFNGAFFGTRVSNIANTPLRQAVNFTNGDKSTTNSTAMELVSKAYNPQKQRMLLQLKTTGNNDVTQQLLAKYVQFQVETKVNSDAEVNVVPVTDNDYLIDINHLAPKFRAIRVVATNDTPITGSTQKTQGQAKFVINEDDSLLKEKVPNKNDLQLAEDIAKQQISKVYKSISNHKKQIKISEDTIKADQERQKGLKENQKYEVASQRKKTQDNLDNLKQDIKQNQQLIKGHKHGIEIDKQRIKLLEKKQKAIENGTFKMPPKQQSTKIKSVN
ncbi:uncharacterized protein pXO2-05/BXB0004/GBAA_pXO2_0004-like [Polyergus mexicanus]|uniref:uncharacterized protein pXO2-05/BXB0004/GBAA_pXO2_0004-like n=1 Tax=Polyergus mexicanus TaxID=615972 RepID=UPI0038B449C9